MPVCVCVADSGVTPEDGELKGLWAHFLEVVEVSEALLGCEALNKQQHAQSEEAKVPVVVEHKQNHTKHLNALLLAENTCELETNVLC